MKSFLINTCLGEKVGSKPQASAKRSILELYDSSEDELNQEAPKKKHLPVVLQYPNYTIIAYVNRFFTRSDIHVKRPAIMYSFIHVKRLAIKDAVGDRDKTSRGIVCKIRSADKDWVMEISDIFQVGPVDGKYFIFVNGKYFIRILNNGNVIYHPWTQTPQLTARNYVLKGQCSAKM
ncbi:Hypothetical predicted protein [Paramuricea clavata]|uniref:Uncharacterized protein n=1 Tax=Paramuricea clavata TaxID=317549 RepID=A0A6S7FQW9_PARCT|nr:Hypothetical predicted protein [Paramuricea clavata]